MVNSRIVPWVTSRGVRASDDVAVFGGAAYSSIEISGRRSREEVCAYPSMNICAHGKGCVRPPVVPYCRGTYLSALACCYGLITPLAVRQCPCRYVLNADQQQQQVTHIYCLYNNFCLCRFCGAKKGVMCYPAQTTVDFFAQAQI